MTLITSAHSAAYGISTIMPTVGPGESSKRVTARDLSPIEEIPHETENFLAGRNGLGASDSNGVQRKIVKVYATSGSQSSGMKRLWSHWKLELLACVMIILVFVALVLTLNHFSDRPQPDWPYGLSINTLVSIYVTLFKLPLMLIASECMGQMKWEWFKTKQQPLRDIAIYEDAIRGPWGCIKLLWTTRGTKIAVTLGALVSLAALSLDPFSQAVIKIYSCQLPDGALPGNVARSNTLQLPSNFPLAMQRQMESAILGVGAFNITPSCSSGNCFFDQPYHSVGFCSSCTNITDRLERNCSLPVNTKPRFATTPLPPCRWYLPHPYTSMGNEYGGFQFVGFDNLTEGVGDSWNLLALDSTEGETQNFTMAWIGREPTEPQAVSCSFQPCIRTYKSAVINGIFTEKVIASINWASDFPSDTNVAAIYARMLERDCLPNSAKQALEQQSFDTSSQWIIYGSTYLNSYGEAVINSTKVDPSIPDGCLYQYQMTNDVLVNATDSISNWFNGVFGQPLVATAFYNDTVVTNGVSSGSDLSNKPPTPILVYTGFQASQSGIMQALYANASITEASVSGMLNKLAITMTNFVRSSPDQLANGPPPLNVDNTAVLTPIILQESCIRINWPWLALPAALIALNILFFCLTVLTAMESNSPGVWKSSTLALLWHGFDIPRAAPESADMEDVARNMHMRLIETGIGWKLVQCS